MSASEHNSKTDAPTEHDRRRLQLLANWYQRQACSFVGKDPLTERQRLSADERHAKKLQYAQLFLDIRTAEKRARQEERARHARRGIIRVIDGHRS